MNSNVIRSFFEELVKLSNTNVDGSSNRNINSTTKPAKVPLSKNKDSVQAPNAVKPLKSKMPKYSFFKKSDDTSKKPDPKPVVEENKSLKVREIMKKYPPAPSGPNVTDKERVDFLLNQKWHKNDIRTIIDAKKGLELSPGALESMPGDSVTYKQILGVKEKK